MHQTRNCGTCSYSESRCVADVSCGGIGCTPGDCNTTSRIYCLADGTWSEPDSADYCASCGHCADNVQNCDEEGVDCGGADCAACGGEGGDGGDGGVPTTTTLEIYKGWNLISSPFSEITNVLEDTCGATNGNFYFYNSSTGHWDVGTKGIQNLQGGIGYWFYSNDDCVVTVEGSGVVMANNVRLNKGWNYVGSPTYSLADVSALKDNCDNCEDGKCSSIEVIWYDPVTKSWEENVMSLETGRGYNVKCVD